VTEVTDKDTDTPQCTMLASIPAGTEPQNEAKAWGSPNWPHWQGTMVKEVSELTSK